MGCAIRSHRPGAETAYNSGYYFAACRRCGTDLIRAARGEWRMVPAGHRVVWKAGCHSHSIEADYAGVLPIAVHEAALPALRSPFVSWGRALLGLRQAGAAKAGPVRGPADEEAAPDFPYPRLLLVGVIVGAGLRMLLDMVSDR